MLFNQNFKSPNFVTREKKIEYIIIHFTEVDFDQALKLLTTPDFGVSAHYLIQKNGEIYQLVSDIDIAWHAGKSKWKGQEALNQNSIGIELDNDGKSEFEERQIEACIKLCKYLCNKYDIKNENIIGHSDVAPERKIDPGLYFNWAQFAKQGLAIWHNVDLPEENYLIHKYGDRGKDISLIQNKLANLGYNILPTGEFDMQTNCVIRAFQAKFNPQIILKKSIDYYFNLKSLYSWDHHSDLILNNLS